MKLSHLTKDIPVVGGNVPLQTDVGGISYDSRKVNPGDAFFCIAGSETDGLNYAGTQ